MSYNFFEENNGIKISKIEENDESEKPTVVRGIKEQNEAREAKEAIQKALKEIKYDLSEIKIMIIGTGSLGNEINKNLKNKCSEIYFVIREGEKVESKKTIQLAHIREEICKMDIVFITENLCKIDKNILILMSNETVIADLTVPCASDSKNNETQENSCVDLESAKKLKIKVIQINQNEQKY